MPIGQKVGSIAHLKETLKTGTGGSFIKFIPKNSSLTVRFLQEPEEWVNYYEHFDANAQKSFPCNELQCPGCEDELRRTSRYLVNVLDVDQDRVIPLQIPKDLATRLVTRYEKYGTMLDRDYELSRAGAGLDTFYDQTPEPPMPRKLNKYNPLDLFSVLQDAYDFAMGKNGKKPPAAAAAADDDDEETSSSPKGRRKPSKSVAVKPRPKPKFAQDIEEDDDDDEEEDEQAAAADVATAEDEEDEEDQQDDDDDYYTESQLQQMSMGELRAIARDYQIKTTGMKKPDIIDAILKPDEDPF